MCVNSDDTGAKDGKSKKNRRENGIAESFLTKLKPDKSEHITPTLFRDVEDRAATSAPKGKETVASFGLDLLMRAPATCRPRGRGKARDSRLSAGFGLPLMPLVRPAVRVPLRGQGEAQTRV